MLTRRSACSLQQGFYGLGQVSVDLYLPYTARVSCLSSRSIRVKKYNNSCYAFYTVEAPEA